jgi:hypothetical protein
MMPPVVGIVASSEFLICVDLICFHLFILSRSEFSSVEGISFFYTCRAPDSDPICNLLKFLVDLEKVSRIIAHGAEIGSALYTLSSNRPQQRETDISLSFFFGFLS